MTDYLKRPAGEIPPNFADVYDETSFWASRFGALLFDCLEVRSVSDGLDVACGTGFPLIELAQIHGPSSRWIGVDIWADALKRAQKKIDTLGIRNVTLQEANAASMPFDSSSFDLITCSLGINNFDDPAAVVAECGRVARRGARFAVTTNVTGHMAEFYELLRDVLRKRGIATDKLDQQERHRGTSESINDLMEDAGFEVKRFGQRDFALPFANGTAMLNHSLVKWFLDGWRPAIGAENEAEVFRDVEKMLSEPVRFTIPALYIEGVKR